MIINFTVKLETPTISDPYFGVIFAPEGGIQEGRFNHGNKLIVVVIMNEKRDRFRLSNKFPQGRAMDMHVGASNRNSVRLSRNNHAPETIIAEETQCNKKVEILWMIAVPG